MKKALLALILASQAGAHDIDSCPPCYENPLKINPSSQPQLCNNQLPFFLSVEALAWQAHENGIPIAIQTENPLMTPGITPSEGGAFLALLRDGKAKNLNFKWDPGFRVILGQTFSCSEIDLNFTWLRFYTNCDKHLYAGSGGQLQPTQLHPLDALFPFAGEFLTDLPPSFTNAKAHWHANLNQLDLDVGRAYYVGEWLSVHPHFGLRATWLQQRLAVDYEHNQIYLLPALEEVDQSLAIEADDFGVRKTARWRGFGPEAGLEIRLGFKHGWSLFGDVAGSAEWGSQQIAEKDFDITSSNVYVDVRDQFKMVRPILDMQIGVARDVFWSSKNCNFHFEAAWEQHVYYSQNQFPLFATEELIADFTTNQGDLSYQGMRFAVEVAF